MLRQKPELNIIYISERMRHSLQPVARSSLTAVVAPMGYGKTTAINWYLNERGREGAAVLRVSIYSANRAIFWKSLQKAFAQAGLTVLEGYECPTDASGAALLLDDLCTALAGPHPLRQLVPWLAPCAAGVILWAVVAHGLNLHFTLQVEVNGTVVGSVATEQNFDTARADLQARLAAARQLADSDTAALPVLEPTYTLHIGGTPMTELQLTDAILRASGSSIVEGTAVYLDGSLAFVTVEGDHLRCFFNQLQRPWRAPRQSNVRTAFLHELRLVDGIYLAGSVQPYHEIIQALQSRDLLQVKTVYTRVYQEPIPYDQQTVERSDLGFGVVETIQQGVDGTQQLTEEVTYVNGVQTAAEVVHIDILTPAVPEITARGTHLAPGMTAELDGYTFIWPVPQYKHVSRWMGGSDNHKGADIAAPRGTPIIASASGTVVTATYHNSVFSYGNYVILDHGDGYRTLYAHMSAFAVKQGDVVQQGQIIGYVGDTGYSFGCHCHFEMFGPGGRFSAQLLFPTL